MEFLEGAEVYTSGEEKVGNLDRVVIDPVKREVTHIVVRKGFLFGEDKVVPIECVTSADEERIVLRDVDEDLEDLPGFEETYYIRADQAEDAGIGRSDETKRRTTAPFASSWYWYPPTGSTWWGVMPYAYARPPYVVRTVRNIPQDEVALEDDAEVMTLDEKKAGHVERLFTDPTDDRVTHILIAEGFLFKEHKLVPTTWISHAKEDRIWLAVTERQLEALPEYEAA